MQPATAETGPSEPDDMPPSGQPPVESNEPTDPTEPDEVPADVPASEPELAAAADVAPAPGERRRKWFRRRSPQAAAGIGVAAASDAATEQVPEETPTQDEAGEITASTEPTEAVDQTPLAERKPVTRRLRVAMAAAAAIFVAAAGFAGAMLQPYLADRAVVNTKLNVARTAASAITSLWTYTPDDMDRLADRSAKYLSGDFADQYRKYVDAIAPTNKQAQVSNSTQVMGAAVEALDGPNATAVVYTNSTYSSPVTKNIPSLRYLSYRLTMQRAETRWLITKMTTITSVDLTPKLG
jgi:Mce-associated membrane protein